MAGASGQRAQRARAAPSPSSCRSNPREQIAGPPYHAVPPSSFTSVQPTFLIVGRFQREYILPPSGPPLLDSPGGDLLYAAGGLAVWEKDIGLLARVSEDLPRQWLRSIEERGFDTRGIRILPETLDMRYFAAYADFDHASQTSPVAHFARRQMTFPKA